MENASASNPDDLTAECHCGSVKIALRRRPDYMNDCNCSLCSKSGAIWGYFSCADVSVTGPTRTYSRRDRDLAAVQIHFCPDCGTTTHWTLTDAYVEKAGPVDRMGVNMRLFDFDELTGVEIRFPDGKNWPGEGDYDYRRAAVILGAGRD